MHEINRFSFENASEIVRIKVSIDDDGFYHISKDTFLDKGKVNVSTGLPILTAVRLDIHGNMDQQAYINWLSNALFNCAFTKTERLTEKQWMMGEG